MFSIHQTRCAAMTRLTCCGPVEPVLAWKYMADGRAHLGGYCPRCGKWIKWLSQNAEWLAQAPPLSPAWGAK